MNYRKLNLLAMSTVVAAGTLLAACGGEEKSPASESSPVPKETEAAVKIEPLGKYDPPITLTTVRQSSSGAKFPDDDSLENNVWTRAFESELGIKLVNNWVVDTTQYAQKMNVSIVSNDLPDFFEVDSKQLQTLVDGDYLADLTEVYNKYATDLAKKALEENNKVKLNGATFNGKLMAIPLNGGGRDDSDMIWIRKDWMDKLGLQAPKSMDDVIKIAIAFATQDPDGNGKQDTFGLNLNKNLFDGYSGLTGFFNGYHAYPYNPTNGSGTNTMWIKDSNGKLVFADIQPEVKVALGKLQELFKQKAISPEFGVMDGTKSAEFEAAGKSGIHFGQYWNANWPLNEMIKKDPKVEWAIYPLVSSDGSPVKVQAFSTNPSKFIVVNKKAQKPEAVFKLLNLYMEKVLGNNRVPEFHSVVRGTETYNTFNLNPVRVGFTETNQNDYIALKEAMRSKDPSKLTTAAKGYYENINKFRNGDVSHWWLEKTWGEAGAYSILSQYKQSPDNYVMNQFYGSPTPTMVERGSTLKDMEGTVFTKIIMGAAPLDEFDKFVADWKSQGGDKITQEVNEWFDKRK